MTLLIDIKTFLVSARTGSFSSAAREINTTPSVVTKRVGRLEAEVDAKLFERSTRKLSLTAEGEILRPQLQVLVAELEETLINLRKPSRELRGSLRVRAPTTIGTMFIGQSVARFQAQHPSLTIELVLMDRQVNPLEEGFDISLGALPQSFASVEEIVFCPYPRVLVAAPKYLEGRHNPESPSDIIEHDCLAFVPVGLSWSFDSANGPVSVDIRARYTVNDSRLLVDSAIEGLGLTVVPAFLAEDAIADGRLIPLMPDYPILPVSLKAMVPRHKAKKPEIVALIEHIQKDFTPPPWAR